MKRSMSCKKRSPRWRATMLSWSLTRRTLKTKWSKSRIKSKDLNSYSETCLLKDSDGTHLHRTSSNKWLQLSEMSYSLVHSVPTLVSSITSTEKYSCMHSASIWRTLLTFDSERIWSCWNSFPSQVSDLFGRLINFQVTIFALKMQSFYLDSIDILWSLILLDKHKNIFSHSTRIRRLHRLHSQTTHSWRILKLHYVLVAHCSCKTSNVSILFWTQFWTKKSTRLVVVFWFALVIRKSISLHRSRCLWLQEIRMLNSRLTCAHVWLSWTSQWLLHHCRINVWIFIWRAKHLKLKKRESN